MTTRNKQTVRQNADRSLPAQIVSPEDLEFFRKHLLEEIKLIFRELIDHGGKKWLRSAEVKQRLGISHGTLQNFRIKGDLPYSKIQGVIFFDHEDVNKMIKSNRIDNSI